MTAIYKTGNLYIGNYEVKAAVEMDTLMNSPICMKVFKSYFEELSEGKGSFLKFRQFKRRGARYQTSSALVLSAYYFSIRIYEVADICAWSILPEFLRHQERNKEC